MSSPDVFIKYYNLSLYPRLRVPVPPSCVHRDSGGVTRGSHFGCPPTVHSKIIHIFGIPKKPNQTNKKVYFP